MISECNLQNFQYFWGEAVNTAYYVINKVFLKSFLNKTSYELLFNKKLIVGYFKIFGCKYFILNIKEYLDKFDKKTDENILLYYAIDKRAYRVYNRRTLVIEDVIHITFNEANDVVIQEPCENDDVGI